MLNYYARQSTITQVVCARMGCARGEARIKLCPNVDGAQHDIVSRICFTYIIHIFA